MQPEFYNEYVEVEDYHWWFRGRSVIIPELIRRHVRPSVAVLDVGSGGGVIASALREFGSVTVCDVDPRCEAAVKRRPGLAFEYGHAEAIPFPDASFDLVTAFDVLEHLDDDATALRELIRVARPGGGIAIAVPAYEWLWGRQDVISGHRRRYTRRSLRQLLEGDGLGVERLTAFNTLLFAPTAAVRVTHRLLKGRAEPDGSETMQSDFSMSPPGALNNVLATVFASEHMWLKRFGLPIGVSLFAFARVPRR